MHSDQTISIAGVSERDIDLLLLEEAQSETGFAEWLVEEALGEASDLGECVGARRSVTHFTGESDLEIDYEDENGVVSRLLIENKVGAGLQPQQAERYRERGDSYLATEKCATYHTIPLAPERYFGEAGFAKGFGARVTYEAVLAWFGSAKELGARRHYKCQMLQSAIEKGTTGWQQVEDEGVTTFWRDYWLLAREHVPELEMAEPKQRASRASFVRFRTPNLPGGARVLHKMRKGFVDLQLRGMGRRVNELDRSFAAHIEEGMAVSQASKSAAVRIEVAVLDMNESVASQQTEVLAALAAARRLATWGQTHADLVAEAMA